MEDLIDSDLVENCEHSDWIDSRDEGRKDKAMQWPYADINGTNAIKAKGIEREANEKSVDQGAQHCETEDGANVVEEGANRHKVARFKDNRREEIEEEGVRLQLVALGVGEVEDQANNDA